MRIQHVSFRSVELDGYYTITVPAYSSSTMAAVSQAQLQKLSLVKPNI